MIDWFKSFLSRIGTMISAFIAGYIVGDLREEKDQLERTLESVRDAKDIAHRVDTDPTYRDDVRSRYR